MADDDKSPHNPVFSEGQDKVYGRPPGAGDWKRITRLTLLGVVIVYVVLFFLMNRKEVQVSLVVADATMPLVWVLLLSFVLGALTMYLLLYLRRRAARKARG